jgi:hypothetical protein
MYAGGDFFTAVGKVSAYAGMASLRGSASAPLINRDPAFGFTNGVFGFNLTGPAGSNAVIDYSTNLKSWIPLQGQRSTLFLRCAVEYRPAMFLTRSFAALRSKP